MEAACGSAGTQAGRCTSLGHMARRAGAGRTVFTFPEKMGVGRMK